MSAQECSSIPVNLTASRPHKPAPPKRSATQAAALAAFSNAEFVFTNLNRTKSDCQGIATYCLYFVLSVADYWMATGDAAGVRYLVPFAAAHLDDAARLWDDPQGLRFVGWDDRLGSGFANNTTPETQVSEVNAGRSLLRQGAA